MTESGPTKSDIEPIFKRLRAVSANKVCFDCQAKNPSWATVTYGVFICLDCSAVHRSLGVHLTFVKSTQLDSNWTWIQLRNMQLGGNANAEIFFRQHNCLSTDAQQKYTSRAAQLYREKLTQMSLKSLRFHGTSVPVLHESESNKDKMVVDFFEEHASALSQSNLIEHDASISKVSNGTISNGNLASDVSSSGGPSVEAALSTSPTQAVQMNPPRKSTIGQRKPASKLGGKKMGGLGAQRVKKNFDAIEKEAERTEQIRQEAKFVQPTKEEQTKSLANLQDAYQKIGLAAKREEEKMKRLDPRKAAQAERLGMGLGAKSGVSHSLFENMKTIKQENPNSKTSSYGVTSGTSALRDSDIEDEFETILRFTTQGPPKYKDSPFEGLSSTRGSGIEDLLTLNKSTSWENDFEKVEIPTTSMMNRDVPATKVFASANYKFKPVEENNAQQKFGGLKAISSEMYFRGSDAETETRANLSRFEGSSSISSADYFGETPRRTHSSIPTPDLDDVRESVRQGVTKVAGRLSSLATNVMSSIQDRYA